MRAKAPWTRASRCEKWAEESRAGMNQYLRHRTESRGQKSSPLIGMGERHFRECLWLGDLQCMSSLCATEKEIPRLRAFASRFSKSS